MILFVQFCPLIFINLIGRNSFSSLLSDLMQVSGYSDDVINPSDENTAPCWCSHRFIAAPSWLSSILLGLKQPWKHLRHHLKAGVTMVAWGPSLECDLWVSWVSPAAATWLLIAVLPVSGVGPVLSRHYSNTLLHYTTLLYYTTLLHHIQQFAITQQLCMNYHLALKNLNMPQWYSSIIPQYLKENTSVLVIIALIPHVTIHSSVMSSYLFRLFPLSLP